VRISKGEGQGLLHDTIQMALASPMELCRNALLVITNWLVHLNGVFSSVGSEDVVWAIVSGLSVWSCGECLVEGDGTVAAVFGQIIFSFMVSTWQ